MTVMEKRLAERPSYIDGKTKLMQIDGRWVGALVAAGSRCCWAYVWAISHAKDMHWRKEEPMAFGNRIAVVREAPSAVVEDVFRVLVDRWRPTLRLAGVLAEGHGLADRACSAGFLRSLGSGERFPVFQDAGPNSTACHLESGGMLAAAEAVCRDIDRGCDLVVLSKFGKLEAKGSGLYAAFTAAVAAGVPVLTSVSGKFSTAWDAFAASSFVVLPADADRIERWRRDQDPVAQRRSARNGEFSGTNSRSS